MHKKCTSCGIPISDQLKAIRDSEESEKTLMCAFLFPSELQFVNNTNSRKTQRALNLFDLLSDCRRRRPDCLTSLRDIILSRESRIYAAERRVTRKRVNK